MTHPGYPNVRLRLRRTATAPGAPDSVADLVLWLAGTRFHLRDDAGRSFSEILADVTEPRGYGQVARTIEDFMDAWSVSGRQGATDIYADLAADKAVVMDGGGPPWRLGAERLAPLAGQVFTGGREAEFQATGERRYLGRLCTEYRSFAEGEEDGIRYRSDIEWLVSPPYLLRRSVKDSANGRLSVTAEVVDIAEGAVTDDDLSLPAV